MKYIKTYENITKSGKKLKDPYFEKDMWVISVTSNVNQEDFDCEKFEQNLLTITRSLMRIFKKNDINYKMIYYEMINICYGVYFMLNKTNFDKLEDNIILPHNLFINKVSDKFTYPDDFEDNIITTVRELKEILEHRHLINKFNV